jgi:hypothetical protein
VYSYNSVEIQSVHVVKVKDNEPMSFIPGPPAKYKHLKVETGPITTIIVSRLWEVTNTHKISVGSPQWERPYGIPRCKWEDNIITINFKNMN